MVVIDTIEPTDGLRIIKGVVYCKYDHMGEELVDPAEYANICISRLKWCKVADEFGRFQFKIPKDEIYDDDEVVVSKMGYTTAKANILDLFDKKVEAYLVQGRVILSCP